MAYIQIRIPVTEKEAAGKVLEDMGLNFSSAIKLFLRRTVQEGKLPFEVVADSAAVRPRFENSLDTSCSTFSQHKIG
jgi:addiction module RelB/DinJ family antitoxin